jgi:hypothetical protein
MVNYAFGLCVSGTAEELPNYIGCSRSELELELGSIHIFHIK